MKRTLSILFVALLALSLLACGNTAEQSDAGDDGISQKQEDSSQREESPAESGGAEDASADVSSAASDEAEDEEEALEDGPWQGLTPYLLEDWDKIQLPGDEELTIEDKTYDSGTRRVVKTNSGGQRVSSEEYNADGKLTSSTVNVYGESGKKLLSRWESANSPIQITEYNDLEQIVRVTNYSFRDPSHPPTAVACYTYWKSGDQRRVQWDYLNGHYIITDYEKNGSGGRCRRTKVVDPKLEALGITELEVNMSYDGSTVTIDLRADSDDGRGFAWTVPYTMTNDMAKSLSLNGYVIDDSGLRYFAFNELQSGTAVAAVNIAPDGSIIDD